MLVGNIAISLNLLSVAVLAIFISVTLVSLTSVLILPQLNRLTLSVRKKVLWVLVTAPWWISIICVAYFFPRSASHYSLTWLNEFAHWHHIDIFSFTSWHAFTLYAALLYCAFSLIAALNTGKREASSITNLITLSSIQEHKTKSDQTYFSLSSSLPAAFTTGLTAPKIFLTTALQKQITNKEIDIIVRHEMAHVIARDPLYKTIFAAFSGVFPFSLKTKLIKQYTLLTEQMADRAVTSAHDNLDVAQTLINVARMQRHTNLGCNGLKTSHFGNDQTTVRVQQLISPLMSSSKFIMAMALMLILIVPLSTAFTVDTLHHLIETLFTH